VRRHVDPPATGQRLRRESLAAYCSASTGWLLPAGWRPRRGWPPAPCPAIPAKV